MREATRFCEIWLKAERTTVVAHALKERVLEKKKALASFQLWSALRMWGKVSRSKEMPSWWGDGHRLSGTLAPTSSETRRGGSERTPGATE